MRGGLAYLTSRPEWIRIGIYDVCRYVYDVRGQLAPPPPHHGERKIKAAEAVSVPFETNAEGMIVIQDGERREPIPSRAGKRIAIDVLRVDGRLHIAWRCKCGNRGTTSVPRWRRTGRAITLRGSACAVCAKPFKQPKREPTRPLGDRNV